MVYVPNPDRCILRGVKGLSQLPVDVSLQRLPTGRSKDLKKNEI